MSTKTKYKIHKDGILMGNKAVGLDGRLQVYLKSG